MDPRLQWILLEVDSKPNVVFGDLGLGLRLVNRELKAAALLGAGVSRTHST